jgi:hypothetical protein
MFSNVSIALSASGTMALICLDGEWLANEVLQFPPPLADGGSMHILMPGVVAHRQYYDRFADDDGVLTPHEELQLRNLVSYFGSNLIRIDCYYRQLRVLTRQSMREYLQPICNSLGASMKLFVDLQHRPAGYRIQDFSDATTYGWNIVQKIFEELSQQ